MPCRTNTANPLEVKVYDYDALNELADESDTESESDDREPVDDAQTVKDVQMVEVANKEGQAKDGMVEADTNTNANTNTDADANTNADADANTNADADANTNADADANTNADANASMEQDVLDKGKEKQSDQESDGNDNHNCIFLEMQLLI